MQSDSTSPEGRAAGGRTPPAYRERLRHILLAVLVGGVAVVARAVAQPVLGDELPFVFAFPATVLAALFWGAAPGLTAAAVCALAVWLPTIPPVISPSQQIPQLGWFLASALFTSVLCGRARARTSALTARNPMSETPLRTWLRTVLFGALLIPLSAFLAASWWTLDRAESASSASLAHALDLAVRHADRTLGVARAIAERADGASDVPGSDVRGQEQQIHLRLADMTAGLSYVVNANVWDGAGSIMVRNDRYPVESTFSIADRDYFRQLQAALLPVMVSEVLVGRQTGKSVFNVGIRRRSPDGIFKGIVTVSLSPSFFSEYYESLANEEPTLATFALVRADGAILARWPAVSTKGSDYLEKEGMLMHAVARGKDSGQLTIETEGGRGTQMVRFQRVGDSPTYVIAGISRTAMLKNWAKLVGILAAILLPTTFGLVYVSWVALRKTQREAEISAQLQEQVHATARAERHTLETQRLQTLSFVTGSVAHDFNNMLAVISSSVHVLKIRRPEVAQDKTIQSMSRAVQAGVRLTRQLLSFSKKQALRPEVIRFQSWMSAADALMRSTLGSQVTWTSDVDDDTFAVKVDPGELELALLNLVLNAKLAMPQGGKLSVHISNDSSAAPEKPAVIVCVMDDGEGIPPDVLARVFEPFFTTRQRGAGSGLGLAQVQGFCAQSGGHATISSALGSGTTVCMHLPASGLPLPPPETVAWVPLRQVHARLLLVEDNEEVGATTEQMLQNSGLTVTRVSSAQDALDWLTTASPFPDIVLSDIAMPGAMNGIALALELGRIYPALPVLLHTGYAEQIEEGVAKGLRVLQKPVPPESLLAELDSMLRSPS